MMRGRPSNAIARRLNRRSAGIFACAIIIVLIALDSSGLMLVQQADDLAAYHGMRTSVARVIDGDTLEIEAPDAIVQRPVTRVRLWGIDCPEAARFERPAELLATEAAGLASDRCLQKEVILWLEAHQTRDSFGRLLAHVELGDGTSLNEALLEAGLAKADDRWPHSRLVRYGQLELSARRKAVGLWRTN